MKCLRIIPVFLGLGLFVSQAAADTRFYPPWYELAPSIDDQLKPIGIVLLVFVVLFGPSAIRKRNRRRRGLCLQCGYDLNGANHAACPECGMAVNLPTRMDDKPSQTTPKAQ